MPWLGTWTPGTGAKVIPVALADGRTVRIAPLICYDVLAPALVHAATRAGAELFVTLSNDSWLAAGGAPARLVVAAFRSIETRRPQVRATNTGISAIITATGDIVAMAGVDARATLAAPVPDGRGDPPRRVGRMVRRWPVGAVVLLRRHRRRTASEDECLLHPVRGPVHEVDLVVDVS
jgi:apolipoprotein N-acyltransferase